MLVFRALCPGAIFSQWICAYDDVKKDTGRRGKVHSAPEKEAFKVLFTTCFALLPLYSYYLYKKTNGEV